MPILQSVDQLHVYYNSLAFAADASLQNVGHTEQLSNFTQAMRRRIAKLHDRRTTNHAHSADLRERGQNVVLNSVGEECVLLVVAKILERQHGDAFLRNRFAARTSKRNPPVNQQPNQDQKDTDDRKIENASSSLALLGLDVFLPHQSFRGEFVNPCQHHRDWKTEDHCDNHPANDRVRNVEDRQDLGDSLGKRPTGNDIRDGYFVDVAAFELREKFCRIQIPPPVDL